MAVEEWGPERVSTATVSAVRAQVDALVAGIVSAIRADSPAYAETLAGPEGVGIRLGIEQAIKSFLDAIELGERPSFDTTELWRRLGEAEFQAGRSLTALRAAWRTGTRAAWRGAADAAIAAGMPAPTVVALAEAMFAYADDLATVVVEGYLQMQSDEAGERERRRRRLASLLVESERADPELIAHAAELARWPLPRTVALVALDRDAPGTMTRALGADVLVGSDTAGSWLVLPDPAAPGRPAAIRAAFAAPGTHAAVGPAVGPREAQRSLRWARLALSLRQRGQLPGVATVQADEHLVEMIVLADHEMAEALLARSLAPLADLPASERERLIETLAAWLAHQRHTPSIAAELHVHPQTVRYRMAKLRELLGDALERAEGRFELQLALRIRVGLAPTGAGR